VILSLLIVEIFLRVFYPFPLSGSWRVQDKNGLLLNKNYITTKHEYILDSKTIRAYYKFGEFNNRIYKSLNYEQSKPKILVLGDSFTFGWLLNDEDTFVQKLSNKYKNLSFINSSAGGWGTSDFLSYIENYCEKISPNITYVFINNTDHERALNSKLYFLDEKNKLNKGYNLINKNKKKLNNILFYDFMIENSHLLQLFRSVLNIRNSDNQKNMRKKTDDKLDYSKNLLMIKKIYKKMKIETKKCGSMLKLINLNWPLDVSNNYFKKMNKDIYDFLEISNFEYVSLKNEMNEIKNNLKFYEIPVDKHPNDHANKYIFDVLVKKKLFINKF
jgi:hypothetical protein